MASIGDQPAPALDVRPRAFIALIGDDGREPPDNLPDATAASRHAAVSACWHPALLAAASSLPRVEDVDAPGSPVPGDVRVVAEDDAARLASGYRTDAEDLGAVVVEGAADRVEIVRQIAARIGLDLPEVEDEAGRALVLDYMALGTARWMLRDLATAMDHGDGIDAEILAREVLTGAGAWAAGDWPSATNRLRAAFELLTQGRERFYPVDAYLIDLCLVGPDARPDALATCLDVANPVTFVATSTSIERLAAASPELLETIRKGVADGWVDVAGGTSDEDDEPLLPLSSILWRFARGVEGYRRHLDDRYVETLARRRFNLYPMLPQIARRFGLRFALHMAFDAGKFPAFAETKRLWESPDHSTLEALMRPPLAADRGLGAVQVPWRLARTMRDDHVATLPMARWPSPTATWFEDLRRVGRYSPVLSRWVTLNDYFHLTDRPYESFRTEVDDYITPYLDQATARGDLTPISGRAARLRLRSRFEAVGWMKAVASSLSSDLPELPEGTPDASALEAAIEVGPIALAEAALAGIEPIWAGAVATCVVGKATGGRPGYLVINPIGVARRVPVRLEQAAADLATEGPLRAAQLVEDGVWAVVDLPAHGYAWIPRESKIGAVAPDSTVSAKDRTLRNERIEAIIDPLTGGIRSFRASGEANPRLAQQLAMVGFDGSTSIAKMEAESFEVEYAGPALVQAVADGALVEPGSGRALARFRQRFRLWSGRPSLEINVTLEDIDPTWCRDFAAADPWSNYIGCRWAWSDAESTLRRSDLLAPVRTDSARPETPDIFDISSKGRRTALLFGGLAHHRRQGARMLDTLLVAGRETCRSFDLAVGLDLEHPFAAALDLTTPAFAVPTEAGPPRTGPAGWLFQVDNPAVAVTRVAYADPSGDGRGWGIVFDLVETAGRPARCRLRLFRDPAWARQIDFQGDLVIDLSMDGDAVLVDLTPREIARVDVTLG